MTARALIVDDEPPARERIRALLAGEPDVEIVAECGDGRSAVRAIRELRPDLLFLDVQMPEMDGFAVLREADPDRVPAVVFVTAYDRYALQAFEVHALDYLLKPFSEGRFRAAVRRALGRLRQRGADDLARRVAALLEGPAQEPRYLDRLTVRSDGRITLLAVREVDWIGAEGNYVRIHAGAASHLVRDTMAGIEARLDPQAFVRIHRSTLVSLSRVKELRPLPHEEYEVLLRDGTRLVLSRRYRARLKRRLDLDA